MTTNAGLNLVVYSREGCHLCDVALEVLADRSDDLGYEVEVIDIESDDRLMLRYLERIPVVECDGEVWFEYSVDPDRLTELVGRADSI